MKYYHPMYILESLYKCYYLLEAFYTGLIGFYVTLKVVYFINILNFHFQRNSSEQTHFN
jgi:hypothetical protein